MIVTMFRYVEAKWDVTCPVIGGGHLPVSQADPPPPPPMHRPSLLQGNGAHTVPSARCHAKCTHKALSIYKMNLWYNNVQYICWCYCMFRYVGF